MNNVLAQAMENVDFYLHTGNTTDAARNSYILRHYANRSIPEFHLYDGWEALLSYDFSDLLILLLLVLTVSPIFTREKENEMTLILSSSKRGKWPLVASKCGVVVLLSVALTAMFALCNVLTFGLLCGFEGWNSPLYAIENYQYTPFSDSVLLFYLLNVSLSLLPYLIGSNFVKYVLPLPAGMLAGTGYVWGTLTEAGYDSEWNLIDIVTFPGITPAMLAFLFIAYWIIIVLLFHFSVTAYVGKRKTARHMIAIPSTMVLLLFSLTGCTSNNTNEISHDFLPYAERGENSAYFIELDMVDNTISATEKAGGNRIILTRDPLSECDSISSVFVDESACYYVTQSSVGKGFEIYRIDLSDFSTRLFFSSVSDNASTFWGLYRHELTADDVLAGAGNISSFVVDGNVIYYLQNGQLYKIHRLSGSETVLLTQTEDLRKLAYQNGAIIYEK